MAANSGPMPLMSSNIAAGAGMAVCSTASNASRAASTVLICLRRSSSRSSSRLMSALRCCGKARPSLVWSSLAPVATQRLISGYALTEQKSFDTIDVSHSLGDERFALAAEVAAVFLVGSGRLDHCTDPRFAALVGEQHSNQRFTIDLVGLCPPAPARRCNRGRVDDMAFDTFVLERPVNPKPVETGLLYDDESKALTRPQSRLLLKLCEALHQPGEIAAGNRML